MFDVSRTRALGRAAVVAGGGSIWGLGLARVLAEAGRWTLLYESPLAVGAVALGCALLVAVPWFWRTLVRPSPGVTSHWSLAAPLSLPLLYAIGAVSGPLAGGVLLLGGSLLALLVVWQDPPRWFVPALLAAVTLSTYLRTLLPSVGVADGLEFQVVATRLGVAHPTGYPLYILLTKLFTFLPLNSVAWRVNLASAVFATAAVVMVYVTVRILTHRPLVSLLTALGFGFSHVFWSQALIAEVYTLHNLFVAAIFWLLLGRSDCDRERTAATARHWQAVLFLVGLSLTNHLTTLLVVPAIGLALVWDRPPLRTSDWLVGGGLLVLGLSVNLYIPLRWPALHDGRWMSLGEFFTYISGGQFHDAMRLDGWQDPTRWEIVARLMREPFGWVGLLVAMLGVADLVVRDRRALALTGVPFLAYFAYGLCYYVADIAVFLLPAHLIMALWMGLGVALIGRLLASIPSVRPVLWRSGLISVFALLPLSRIWINLPRVDMSRDQGGYAWGRYVLDQPLVEDSAILADTNKFAPLYYLQQVEGVRPDLDIVLLGTEELYQADLRRRLVQGQTVYLARYLPHVQEFFLQSVGPLVEVRDGAPEGSPVAGDGIATFGEGVHLLGAELSEDRLAAEIRHLELRWRAETSIAKDLVVRIRLLDGEGRVRWTSDGSRPVGGLYPTNAWVVGAPISDYHEVPLPGWLAPGSYSLEIGLFLPFDGEGVPITGKGTPWLEVGTLELATPSDPDPLSYRALYSLGHGVWLTGFDLPGESGPGAEVTLDLAWDGVGGGEQVRVRWVDGQGREAGTATAALEAGAVRSRHVMTTPAEADVYRLELGLVDGAARCDWLASPRDACPLTEVRVVADKEGLADFGTRVLLADAEVGRTAAGPGEVIPVTLLWRGLRPMDRNYTVFVHLLGPDGRLHGQADSWPVHGSFPTSEWPPGREVTDRYEVRLNYDAPGGQYQVQVGWYLLDTMERLPVLGERGEPVADSFPIGEFEVR